MCYLLLCARSGLDAGTYGDLRDFGVLLELAGDAGRRMPQGAHGCVIWDVFGDDSVASGVPYLHASEREKLEARDQCGTQVAEWANAG